MERKPYPSHVMANAWALPCAHSLCWLLRSLLIGVLTCWLVACASLNTTTTPYAGAPPSPPRDPASVQILRTQPTQPHDRLGQIIVDSATHSATLGPDVEQKLRQAAAKLGADAVVVVYDRRQPVGAYVMGGYWDQSVETVTERDLVGVAIKYRP